MAFFYATKVSVADQGNTTSSSNLDIAVAIKRGTTTLDSFFAGGEGVYLSGLNRTLYTASTSLTTFDSNQNGDVSYRLLLVLVVAIVVCL